MRHNVADPIAVIGAACRFPGGASDLTAFWALLKNGVDAVTALPEDRCSRDRYFSAVKRLGGHSYSNAAGVVEHTKEFDSEFFGISRKEAQSLDPQQRMALEVAWEALEQANISASSLRGSSAGVFMGASNMDMALHRSDDPAALTAYTMTSSALSIIANRISYFLDLHGPSLTVDTACSSSLAAVHMACEEIRAGRIPLAVAGGVNLLLAPFPFIGFARARMLSPTGRCRVFDAAGDGYVRGEGAGAVILKPLAQALKDGDTILAVIEGSGVNSDGRTTGLSLPNGKAQAALIAEIYERFNLDKSKLAYVEAHGTGTTVGDPIEASAVGEVLGKTLKGVRPLQVGSVKSNIGHLEPASGMAGLLKALLVLQHGEIPPNIHLNTPNPAIDFSGLNITVPTALTPLPDLGGNELVSINSFGFGGTNAHVVLRKMEENSVLPRPSKKNFAGQGQCGPFFLTAKSRPSLTNLAGRYADLLEGADTQRCYDTAATLALHREQMRFRALVGASSPAELAARLRKLEKSAEQQDASSLISETAQSDGAGVFVFTGNGSQWAGMGANLFAASRPFREAVEEADALFAPLSGWSIMDTLRNPAKHAEAFDLTEKNQPLLFALQIGLVRALAAKGLVPAAVTGHSVGEVAAAASAGILRLPDAVKVIHFRSLFQASTRDAGGMAVANMTEKTAAELLGPFAGAVEVAAVNTAASLTLAGESKALRSLLQRCKRERIATKSINVLYPFHTRAMDAFRQDLLLALQDISPRKARIPFFSTAYAGKRKTDLDNEYWWNNIRRPVRFAAAIEAALAEGHRLFLEIGPAPLLLSYLRDTARRSSLRIFAGATLSRHGDEAAELDEAWKNAWKNGWSLDAARHFSAPWRRRPLPLYPWNREFLWVPDSPECRSFLKEPRKHPLLGWQLPGAAPIYENTLNLADFPWLADHKAGNNTPYPAAAFIESMLAAAREMHPAGGLELSRIALFRPLNLSADSAAAVRISLDPEDGGLLLETRPYLAPEPFSPCAKARVTPFTGPASKTITTGLPLAEPQSFGVAVDKDALYEAAARFSLHYGPAFRPVERAWVRSGGEFPEVLACLAPPDPHGATGMLLPPTLLDGAFQTLFLLLGARRERAAGQAYLPVSFERVVLYSSGVPRFAHARLDRMSPRSVAASFLLLDADGEALMRLSGCRFRRAAWLEQEKTPPAPYVMDLEHSPHPDADPLPARLPFQAMRKKMEKALRETAFPDATAAPVHPYLLLQFAALSSMHESVLSLCGFPEMVCDLVPEELVASGKLAPSQESWLFHMLERLESANLAAKLNGQWQIQPRGQRPSATALWRTLVSSAPGCLPEASLLAHTASICTDVLRGSYDARPGEALPSALAATYFNNAAVLSPFAAVLEQGLRSLFHGHNEGETRPVMQLAQNGAALLARALPLLRQADCRYTVGAKDTADAENLSLLFTQEGGPSFRALNPENLEPELRGSQHCIIASFSLHEHDNSALVLENCLAMLAPGGVLCLVEHAPSAFMDYVFGSRPSWWSASADRTLPVSRLQPRSAWEKQMRDAGFTEVSGLGEENDAASPAFIILGKKPPAAPASTAPAPGAVKKEEGSSAVWLLVSGKQGTAGEALAERLAEELRTRIGVGAVHVRRGDMFGKTRFAGQSAESWTALLAAMGGKPLNLVYLGGYDTRPDIGLKELACLQTGGPADLAALASAWDAARTDLRLWVVTGGALAGNERTGAASPLFHPVPSQGALAGFVRVLSNELRGLTIRLLDLHTDAPDLAPALRELLHPTEEPETVLVGDARFVPRLTRLAQSQVPVSAEPRESGCSLAFDTPGRLQNLYWKKTPLPLPGPGRVRVAVRCTGLNFRDVMWSMGLLPDEALENGFSGPTLGIECSGVIDALGDGVQDFALGDEVFGFAPACFSTHVIAPAESMIPKPKGMRFTEAASLPVAFITAWYAIKHLAAMQKGERILIHGAAGGVGLAAVQIAAQLGLEVYATAGAPEKHAFLRRLGVKHLFSSRSLAFAPQIMEATNGRGVDAVLNSLAGEAIAAGLSVLRPFGRFLELGKRDFYADSPMRLAPFSNNLSYFGIDVDQLFTHQPALTRTLFRELAEFFASRKFLPLPHAVFPAGRAVESFQAMQHSTHIGKLVVAMDGAKDAAKPEQGPLRRMELAADATYLVTGGCGGFGLATAERLAKRGAKHLLLLSRSGPKDAEAVKKIEDLRDSGVSITLAAADVADAKKLRACLKKQRAAMPPLRGVIHAAAALDDGLIASLTPERIRGSLAAKSLGAWNLHEATLDCPLDFFVLYSSATTAFGNPGQAGYVAANCMLETLANRRRLQKLPAQVIGWGPIGDTGMLARNEKARQVLYNVLGVGAILSSEALDWLEHCLDLDIGASHYFGLDWQNKGGQPDKAALASPRLARLRPRRLAAAVTQTAPLEYLRSCSAQEGTALVASLLAEEIAAVLRLPKDKLALDAPLVSLGMDSLMGMELSLTVEQKFEITGYVLPLSEEATTASLAAAIYTRIAGEEAADGDSENAAGTLLSLERKHKVHLPDAERDALLKTLKGNTRG